MKTFSKSYIVIFLTLFALILASCGGEAPAPEPEAESQEETAAEESAAEEEEEEATAEEEEAMEEEVMADLPDVCQGQDGSGLRVGFGNLGEQVPFAVQVREGIESVAADCGLEIVNADNALDPQIAVDNSRLFMTQSVDGIIHFNVHGDIADSICDIIGETPMIAIDIAHENCSVFMGANNRRAGELGGIAAGELAKELWNCEIDAIVTHEAPGVGQVNIDRLNGQIAGLQSVCPDVDYGDFENWSMDPVGVITRLDSDRVDPGFEKGRDYLTANQDKEHIVALCINDDSCLGMLAATQEAGREDQVIFSSQGADATSWVEIRNNPMWAGSVAYFPERYGEFLVPNIIRLINSEETDDPILMEHISINKDNIDDWYPEDGSAPAAMDDDEAMDDEAMAEHDGDVCQGQDGGGMRIGFGNLGEQVPFAVQVREGIEKIAAECNVEIVNADNALDPQIAVDNTRLFMTQSVDGIIHFNVHGDIAQSICDIAAGTPMIAIDIAHEGCSVFMGANNRRAGELGGIAAGELAKELWNCEIDAIVTHEAPGVGQVNIDRLNGQVAGLQSVCPDVDYGDFENWSMDPVGIITRLDSDRVDPGFEKGRDYLTANQDKEHIVALCINDDSCLGMLAATQEAGREDQVIFSSQGADATSWVEIRNNPMWAGSVAYFPERYGEFLIPNIIRLVNGEETDDPILMEHVSINKDNIDQWYPEDGSMPADDGAMEEEAMADDGDVCQGQDGTGLRVGFGNLGEQVPFAVQVREGIESIASECGLEIVNADNALDPQIAVDNTRLFMTQNVDGIIHFNVHGDIADSICDIATGTPMIAIDIAHEACSVFMGANNRRAGELGGIAAGELAKELWDCEIDAIVTHEAPGVGQVNIDRLNGQVAGLQSVCPDVDYGDFENWSMDPVGVITRLDSDRVDPGFEKGRDYLTANQDKERIVALCINDDSCLGMLAATQEAGREDQVIFSSQGADATSWVEIRNNPMWAGSVAYFPERYGEFLVPNIIRLINGEETDDPILMEHISINKDNIDDWYPEE